MASSFTIDPSQGSGVVGGAAPAKKKQQPVTAAGNSGPKTFDMRSNGMDDEKVGVVLHNSDDKGIAGVISTNSATLFSGDPALLSILDKYVNHITGERSFPGGQNGARFGCLGIFARKTPKPVLWDDPNMIPYLGETMCIDTAGRTWVYAPFFKERLAEDIKGEVSALACLAHEYDHGLLEHNHRMRNFPPMIANVAMDRIVNPMVTKMWKDGTKFSKFWMGLYGNNPKDAKYKDLAEETIAKMMMSEMAEKGTIKIGTLTIKDGPVTTQTTYSAAKDEINDLGDITVYVEDKGMQDVVDTIFDCGIIQVDKIDNQLTARNRQGKSGGKGQDHPITIPNISPDNILDSLGDPGSANGDPSSHMADIEKIREGLKRNGHDDVSDQMKMDSFDPHALDRIREQAFTEAAQERERVGSAYPGAHIEQHYGEVVKPARAYNISWDRRAKEFLQGSGPILNRNIDEPGFLTYVDPLDMNMTEDEQVYMAGLLPEKPDDKMFIIFDTSASVDKARLAKFISVAMSARQSADDLAPEIVIIGADTVIRGVPTELDDDALAEIAENGYQFAGRGGTDVIVPLNQLMKYARENDIKIAGILYCTDLGIFDMEQNKLPEDLPALMFLAIPEDYKACQAFVNSVKDVAEVVVIEKDMELNLDAADAKAANRGRGIDLK